MILISSSLIQRLLLTLSAAVMMAAAFVPRPLFTNQRPAMSMKEASHEDNIAMMDDQCKLTSEIHRLLIENQLDLLSNASKRHKLHPMSTVDADNDNRGDLPPPQAVQEALLSSRLNLPFLRRTKLGPSKIDGAGRGLFATENIFKGEVITCYPGDALLYELPSIDDDDGNANDENENDEEFANYYHDEDTDDDDGTETIVLWGSHVPVHHVWDDDTVFDGSDSTIPLTSYAVSVDDHYSVMGHPALDDDPAYYGHFANDGAGHLALEGSNSPNNLQAAIELGLDTNEDGLGAEMNIAAYVLKSLEVANAWHKSLVGGSHVVTVATRDIAAGEEILVTYGPDYWLGHS